MGGWRPSRDAGRYQERGGRLSNSRGELLLGGAEQGTFNSGRLFGSGVAFRSGRAITSLDLEFQMDKRRSKDTSFLSHVKQKLLIYT